MKSWCAFIAAVVAFAGIARVTAAEESTVYDANPNHPWNQLNQTLFQRTAQDGKKYGLDELDILYWVHTTNLLAGASYNRAVKGLDRFIDSHGEKAISDPLKRAFLQRDLWQLFDWLSIWPSTGPYAAQRKELESRLVMVIHRLALTTNEIAALPDNYALTDRHLAPDLPRGLFETNGDWVILAPDLSANEEIAPVHDHSFFGQSAFLVMFRVPEGRQAALSYLQQLRKVEHFWMYVTNSSPFASTNDPREILSLNTNLPEFPANTRWAIARRMLLIDANGNLQPTPITESIQVRRYLSLDKPEIVMRTNHNGVLVPMYIPPQDFYEFQMDRRHHGALRQIARDEKDFLFVHFLSKGFDPFQWEPTDQTIPNSATFKDSVLDSCRTCHTATGIYSVNVFAGIFHPRNIDPPALWKTDINRAMLPAIDWKQRQYSWGLLQGLWNQGY